MTAFDPHSIFPHGDRSFTDAQLRAADEFFGTYEHCALSIAYAVARLNAADLDAAVEGRQRKAADALAERHNLWPRNPTKALNAIRLPAVRQPGALILPFNGKFIL